MALQRAWHEEVLKLTLGHGTLVHFRTGAGIVHVATLWDGSAFARAVEVPAMVAALQLPCGCDAAL